MTLENTTKTVLERALTESLDTYFNSLEGHLPTNLYPMVIAHVEKIMFSDIMKRTDGNQSQAALMLGISRNTLRDKLKNHGLTSPSP